MNDLNGVAVLAVTGRQSRDGKHTMFDVALSDGNKYTTFNPDLATKANALINQQVSARVEVVQNGRYTNFNLEDIAPMGQLPPMAVPPGTPVGLPQAAPVSVAQAAAAAGAIPMAPAPESDQVRSERITRATAFSTAFGFVGDLFSGSGPETYQEATELAIGLARQLYTVILTGQPYTEQEQAPETPQTPQEVAQTVNEQAGQPVVQTGNLVKW